MRMRLGDIAGVTPLAVSSVRGTGLREARRLFEQAPNAIRQAIFLTDGKNEAESKGKVGDELMKSDGLFECDCWGVGTDWRVGEVQEIARALRRIGLPQ